MSRLSPDEVVSGIWCIVAFLSDVGPPRLYHTPGTSLYRTRSAYSS